MKASKPKRPSAARRRKLRPPNCARGEVRFDMGWVSDSKIAETLKRGEAYAMKPDRRWRVTFPKPLREKYDIRPGDKLRFEREGDKWAIVFPARLASPKPAKRKGSR